MISIRSLSIQLTLVLASNIMMAMSIQPVQESIYTCRGESDAVICSAIVQAQRVSIRQDDMTTGKDHISNIPNTLIILFSSKDPLITADQANLRRFQVKERNPQPV